jgi:hypothetical protein
LEAERDRLRRVRQITRNGHRPPSYDEPAIGFVVLHLNVFQTSVIQGMMFAPQANQPAMPFQQTGLRLARLLGPVELAAFKGLPGLRIWCPCRIPTK